MGCVEQRCRNPRGNRGGDQERQTGGGGDGEEEQEEVELEKVEGGKKTRLEPVEGGHDEEAGEHFAQVQGHAREQKGAV